MDETRPAASESCEKIWNFDQNSNRPNHYKQYTSLKCVDSCSNTKYFVLGARIPASFVMKTG